MKDGVRIINCARGGLVDEEALAEALKSGKVAGAASTCSSRSRPRTNPLFGLPNVICTPHLGASTTEAQENVALQVAEQMSDYLMTGEITNALNMPSITAEEAPRLTPWVKLAEQLGSFAGQLTETAIKGIRIEYEGDVAELNTRAMTAARARRRAQAASCSEVNMVSAPLIARERGINVEEVARDQQGAYESYIRLTVTHRAAGARGRRHGVRRRQAAHHPGQGHQHGGRASPAHALRHQRGQAGLHRPARHAARRRGVNIANFNLGRAAPGEDAIALIEVDEPITDAVLAKVRALDGVVQARRLSF